MSFYGIKLGYNSIVGNHYTATNEIKCGEIVFTEKFSFASPLLIQIENGLNNELEYISRCANWKCWKIVKKSTGYICKNCNYSIYCSEKCYNITKIWNEKICDREILQDSLSLCALYFAIGVKVTLNILHLGTPNKNFKIKILKFVQKLRVKFPKVDIEKLIVDTTRLHFIAFPMKTFIGEYTYASAFFLYANYFNHSCEPNCYYYFIGDQIYIRALKTISKEEEITIPYDTDFLYTSKELRRETLINLLGCSCNCPRCNDPIKVNKEKLLFETMKGKPNPIIRSAVMELAKEYKPSCNFSVLIQLAKIYHNHFELTHAMGFEVFKKYQVHLWETSRFDEGLLFSKKLIEIIQAWKVNGIKVNHLESWSKVLLYILSSYQLCFNNKKKATKSRQLSYLEEFYQLGNVKQQFDMDSISIYMLDCHTIMNNFFHWKITEMDEEIHPLLKQVLELAKDSHQMIIDHLIITKRN